MDPPPVQYATTTDGMRIACAVSGKGQPFLLLPGALEHVLLAWQYPQLDAWVTGLAERFQLIQMDERGAGMSTRGLAPGHVRDDYLLDIEAVVDKLRPDPLVILAANVRVQIAVRFAVRHPEMVRALVLGPLKFTGATDSTALFQSLPAQNWDLFLRSLVSLYQAPQDIATSIALQKQSWEQSDFVLRMQSSAKGVAEEDLQRVTMPTLVLYPRNYPVSTEGEAAKAAHLARGSMAVIDGSFVLGNAEQGIRAIEAFLEGLPDAGDRRAPHTDASLSEREIGVLRLIASGKSNQQIADELVISIHTVGRHVSNILDKVGAANRVEATVYARDRGLV